MLFFIFGFLGASTLWTLFFLFYKLKRKKKIEQLVLAEKMLNQLLSHSPIHVFFKDDKMRALKLSKNYEELVGMPLEKMLGKTMDDLFPSDFAKKIIADDIKILKEGKPVSLEEEFKGRFYTTIKFPINVHGSSSYLAGFTIDITERKLMEKALLESQRRFSEAQKLARFGDWIWDIKTGDVEWSDEVYNIFHLKKGEFKPQIDSILAFSPWPEDHERNKELIERATNSHEVGTYEQRFLRHDGTEGYYLSNFKGKYDSEGKLTAIVGILQDITDKKRAEKSLRELNAHLEQTTLKAELANKAKSEFISNISHEIRTPLNSILGFADYLLETCKDDERKGYLIRINKSGQTLLALINNILELSKIESGVTTLDIRPVFLPTLLNDSIEMFRERSQKKNINLKLELMKDLEQAYILTDPIKLQRVLINLLNNAIKFTEKGEVCLIVKKEQADSGALNLRFSVRDTGIGIPKEKQSLLFQRFFQIDSSSTKKYEGTGLGLNISREIVELMGGKITFDSVENLGSQFTFYIPFIETSEHPQRNNDPQEKNEYNHKRLHILIADDSEENRTLLQVYLKGLPFDVDFAVDGADAFEKFKNKKYDLILMDMQMPEVDGFSATKKIRDWEGHKKLPTTPVIALTGFALREEKEKCLNCGCSFHMPKPIKKDELLKVISDFSREIKNT